MKKAFLLALLAITLNLSAQSTTYFAKPLELNAVPVSTSKSDSVVVWSNKILKHVPRSEFSAEPKAPSLSQVLESGSSAVVNNEDFRIDNHAGPYDYTRIQTTSNYTQMFGITGDSSGRYDIIDGKVSLRQDRSNWSTTVDFADPVTETFLRFPAKPYRGEGNTYTIATLDDIPSEGSQNLQQVLENGSTATLGALSLDYDATKSESMLGTYPSSYNLVQQIENRVAIAGVKDTDQSNINISDGLINIQRVDDGGLTTTIDILKPIQQTKLSFPAKEFAGDYVLATTEDFKTINGQSIVGDGDIDISGSIPNLQQVLDTGNTAIDKNISLTTSVDNSEAYLSPTGLYVYGDITTTHISGEEIDVRTADNMESTSLNFEKITHRYQDLTDTYQDYFKFPKKNTHGGEYTLATLDDITSGGSQNLQQVLDQGGTAVGRNIRLNTSDSINGDNSELTPSTYTIRNTGSTQQALLVLERGNYEDDLQQKLKIGQIKLNASLPYAGENLKSTTLLRPDEESTRIATFKFKKSNVDDAIYTLATTDDLTLQQVLNTGKNAIGKSIELTNTDVGTEHYLTLDGYECTMANLATNKYINFNNSGYYSRDYDTGEIASLSHNSGIYIAGIDPVGQTISTKMVKNGIEFRNSNAVIFLKIPNQSTGGGNFFNLTMPSKDGILATTDDIKLQSYTVGTLPTGTIGDHAYVTDATAPTYLGGLIGGGSVVCPVFYNGTTWVSH